LIGWRAKKGGGLGKKPAVGKTEIDLTSYLDQKMVKEKSRRSEKAGSEKRKT